MVKKYSTCKSCPLYRAPICDPNKKLESVDVLFVAFQPNSASATSGVPHHPSDNVALRKGIESAMAQSPEFKEMSVAHEYVVRCQERGCRDDAKAAVVKQCRTHLADAIARLRPKVIVALGKKPTDFLLPGADYTDSRSTIAESEYGPVMVSMSDQVLYSPGRYLNFVRDCVNALRFVARGCAPLPPLENNVLVPEDMDGALDVVQKIIDYKSDKWAVSLDVETSSLMAHNPQGKIISFCFGWDKGECASVLFDHPRASEEYLARLPELRAKIQELLTRKPVVMHNGKFDYKWIVYRYGFSIAKFAWDTILGEHLLEEDKSGAYGLKLITAQNFPQYAGYSDTLHGALKDAQTFEQIIEDEIAAFEKYLMHRHPQHPDNLRKFLADHHTWRTELVAFEEREAKYQEKKAAYLAVRERVRAEEDRWKEAKDSGHLLRDSMGKPVRKPKMPIKMPRRADFDCTDKPVAPKRPEDPRTKKEKQITNDVGFEPVPIKELLWYGAIDGDVTRQLMAKQVGRVRKEGSKLISLMKSHCIPASIELGRMEHEGINVDKAYIDELNEGLTQLIETAREELYAMALPAIPDDLEDFDKNDLNINSDAHLAKIIHQWGWVHPDGTHVQPIPVQGRTPTGLVSVSSTVLGPIIKYCDDKKTTPTRDSLFLHTYFKHAKALKARDTFLENIRALALIDGRVHTRFNINGTATGRLSSADPNMQNIPKTLGGWNIKKLFIADNPEEEVVVDVDYSSLEVMVLTAYARDPELIDAINKGLDMHCFVAGEVYGIPYDEIFAGAKKGALSPQLNKDYSGKRTAIKRVVFGVLYGAGPKKIAESIGISKGEAKKIIRMIFDRFPKIQEYIDRVNQEVVHQGYVETQFGRRRRSPLAKLPKFKARSQRQGVNFLIQSTGSDIVLGQLLEMAPAIRAHGGNLRITVHDSYVFTWPKSKIHLLQEFCEHYLCTRANEKYEWLPVKLRMEVEIGDSYGEVMSIDKYLKKHPYIEMDNSIVPEFELLNELRKDAYV